MGGIPYTYYNFDAFVCAKLVTGKRYKFAWETYNIQDSFRMHAYSYTYINIVF